MLLYFFYIVSAFFIFYLIFPFITVVFSLFSKDKTEEKQKGKPQKEYDFGNIITAYRNADIARGLVESLIQQTHGKHHIYLVADNADVSKWADFKHEKFTLLKPEPALNLKIKSVIYGTERYVRNHEYTVIWDADNLAHPRFLEIMNAYANAGEKAIQGQRTAKNHDTAIAGADSLGEYYKNYIERQVPPLLGSSTVISGSGMAVERTLYDAYLYGEDITKGKELWKKMMQEDKILQNHILNTGEQIVYAKDAICYDEKVTEAAQVETQRSRWLYSYFQNTPNSTGFILKGLFGFNWNRLFFGLITFAPPLFILLGLSGLLFLIGLFVSIKVSLAIAAAGLIFIGTIFWTLKLSDAPPSVWAAVDAIPTFISKQFLALFKMVNPNKNFTHTDNKVIAKVDDVLKEK
jgi:cellulose synthase/poly-beta-1,6-N-acetylglucosamine synthase-like glycosyltransferase